MDKHDMIYFDVRIGFPSGLVKSYLDFLLSFNYPLGVLIPLNVIAKESRSSGFLNTLLVMFHVIGACKGTSLTAQEKFEYFRNNLSLFEK